MLNVLVEQVIPQILVSLIPAILIYGIVSVMYKRNLVFGICQNFVIAFIMAQGVAQALRGFHAQAWTPLLAGDIGFIIPLLLALGYFTILTRKYINVYRLVFLLTFMIGIGTAVVTSLGTASGQLLGMAALGDINSVLYLIFFIAAISYFTFSKRLEAPLRPLRSLGLVIVLLWAGQGVATLQTFQMEYVIGWQLLIVDGPGIYVIAILAIGILLDVVGFWRALGFGKPKEEAVTPTTT